MNTIPPKTWQTEEMTALFEIISQLQTPEEVAAFLRDACTISELTAISERWLVAQLIAQSIPYRKIHDMTGVSTATITRVAHSLHHGEGGYELAIEKKTS